MIVHTYFKKNFMQVTILIISYAYTKTIIYSKETQQNETSSLLITKTFHNNASKVLYLASSLFGVILIMTLKAREIQRKERLLTCS